VSVVNALSERLEVVVDRDGSRHHMAFARGKTTKPLNVLGKAKGTGTTVTFKPDPEMFSVLEFSYSTLADRLRQLSFLNKGITIKLRDERKDEPKEDTFFAKGGLVQFVEWLNRNKKPLHPKPIAFSAVKDDIEVNLPKRGGKTRPLTKEDFSQKSAIFLQPKAQFDTLVALPDSADRAKAIIDAMESIEADYDNLRGVLPKSEYQELDNAVLDQLLRTLNPEKLKRVSGDVFGRICEYFLTQFADQKAHDGGEFFTPVSLVSLIANVIEPFLKTVAKNSGCRRPILRRTCGTRLRRFSCMCSGRIHRCRHPTTPAWRRRE